MGGRRWLAALALAGATVFAVQACASPQDGGSSVAVTIPGDVRIADGALILREPGGEERVVATTDPATDGELVHAALRPGERDRQTVLALTRVDDVDGVRYELRYVTVDGDDVTDLYWFPWRLQVADDLADTLDAPPFPVWAPDGESLAWLEWGPDGTRLRTIAWRDEDVSSNPSDDTATYALDEVPPGTQLRAWERGEDGVPVLRGSDGETEWRIRLDTSGASAVAMADPSAAPTTG
ncbi:hypothetical protein [Egicoccus sp. AB-alg2]|uniref:hypothetical protein n=1 Tax=Egicoccus sp. AB-alg2 TaxID=3242693 RepID=UPI00359CBD2C